MILSASNDERTSMIKFKYTTKPASENVANAVCQAIRTHYGLLGTEYGPEVRMNWDWFGGNPVTAIIWEGGPFDWAVEVDMLLKHKNNVWTEAITSWSTAVWHDVRTDA